MLPIAPPPEESKELEPDRPRMTDAAPSPPPVRRKRKIFDMSFWLFVALAVAGGVAVWFLRGPERFYEIAGDDLRLILRQMPLIVAGMLMGGFAQALVPRDLVARWLGRESGWKGLAIATVTGAMTPGGPIVSFPVVAALATAGADMGALVAYLTAWSALAFNRVLIWELPFMGPEFALIRVLSALPLPIIAGLIARALVERYGTGLAEMPSASATPPAGKDGAA